MQDDSFLLDITSSPVGLSSKRKNRNFVPKTGSAPGELAPQRLSTLLTRRSLADVNLADVPCGGAGAFGGVAAQEGALQSLQQDDKLDVDVVQMALGSNEATSVPDAESFDSAAKPTTLNGTENRSPLAAETSNSNETVSSKQASIVVSETGIPTPTLTTSISVSLPMAQNAGPCCGTCGYVNCPLQALALKQSGQHTALAGQSPGIGTPGTADYIVTGSPGLPTASISDHLFVQRLVPLNWDRASSVGTTNGALPGGGSNVPAVADRVGILSGPVSTTTTAAPPVTPTAINPVVLENEKPGNPESEWGIDGAGDSNIEGYSTNISVNVGTPVDFKINTDSDHYRIDIYRLGYYGGLGARKVGTIDHTGVQDQPDALVDQTTGLVDAGNWSVSASWNVPADAVSGVYIAKLTREDGTSGENQIPFIVRDDSSHSDIVFQTSDETWQAYNGWGGANLYGGDGPATGQGAGRAYAVSYNRPIDTRGGVGTYAGPQDYLFGAEYSAISWMEENGYDVSYMAGVDTDRYGSLLLNHKVFVDAGHDEYWSGQQRANVEAARDAGVNLQFWSGNEVYWRTRWGDSISDDSAAYRTMITYKDTWAGGQIDPSGQWTGTFRDPRFDSAAGGGAVPENSLTGQLFQVDDVGADLGTITIPYEDADMRFWRNTSVADLQPGQTASLTTNYLGYEWDEAPDNGFDPAGLVKLSSTTVDVNSYLLDYGNTTGAGTATHNLTLYRAPSGALVFGAGTVYWPWALSANHDNEETPADPNVQQAMINLFADMGVQPGTLQAGLIKGQASTDHTAPVSIINNPETAVAGSTVTITGTASDVGGVVAGVEISTDNGASWHPVTGDNTWTYTWSPQVAGNYTILSRAVDDSINLETPSSGLMIDVAPAPYLSLFPGSATPETLNTLDASPVELGMKFVASVSGTVTGVRFYKSSQDTGVHTGELWSSAGTQLATVTFTNETASGWQSATFSNPVTITPGTTYTVSYHTTVGHYSNTSEYFSSDVVNGPLTAPAVSNGVFAYGNGGVAPAESYQATNFWVDVEFNPASGIDNVAPVAVDDSGFALARDTAAVIGAASLIANDSDANGDALTITAVNGAVNGTVVLNTQANPANTTITFTPAAGYTGPATFSYTISDGRGGTATAKVNLDVEAPGTEPLSLFNATNIPQSVGLNDGQPLEVGVKFNSSTAGSITALKFYRSAGDTGPDLLDLWSSTGSRLASATFADTSATGWQTVQLTTPVTITANTTYIASYHTNGTYVATNNYFTSAVTSGSLTAPSSAAAGGNGVYAYGGTSTNGLFPTNTFSSGNYFADVVFTPSGGSAPGNTAPTAVADVGNATEKGGIANGSGGSPASGNVLVNDTDSDTGDTKAVASVNFGSTSGALGSAMAGAHGSLVLNADGSYTYAVNENDATVQALRQSSDTVSDVFSYTMRDTAGATSATTLTISIHGANDAPVLASQTTAQNAVVGSPFSLTLSAGTFTDVDSGDSLTYATTMANGTALPGWLTFNPTTRTLSGTPGSTDVGALSLKTTVTDLGGLTTSETFSVGITTTAQESLFSSTSTPQSVGLNDGQPLEVGVKFNSSTAGSITALKFYRSAGDTGPDLLDLWSSTGSRLASATFADTSATGWQTVQLTTPVTITANTTYIASYHTNGTYVATNNYFTSAVTSGSLTAPSSAAAGGNGVYAYGGTSTNGLFPTNTFSSGNYFADVVFTPSGGSAPGNTAPTAVADVGNATEKGGIANGSGGSPASGNVLVNDTDSDTGDTKAVASVNFGSTSGALGSAMAGAHGSLVLNADGSYTYAVNENDATVQALRQSSDTVSDVFSYTMRDTAGATSATTLTISIHGANDAPVLASQTTAQNAVVGSPFSLTLSAGTFTDVDSGDSLTYATTMANGTALPGWLTFNPTTRTLSGTPGSTDVGALSLKTTVTDLGGLTTSETFSVGITTTAQESLFSSTSTPQSVGLNDGQPLEVGVKFNSSTAGSITALKFYRSAGDTGPDLLDLWSSTGSRLASATFADTSATGWQTVQLTTPVTITANTTYIASYHTNGPYAATSNFFNSPVTSGSLTAPSSAAAGGNGVYAYGGTSTDGLFPTNSFNAANYWADVVFRPQLAT